MAPSSLCFGVIYPQYRKHGVFSRMNKNRKIHWLSYFWFFVAIVAVITFINEQKVSLLLQALSFSFLGYSSIRLVPGDLFARKISFRTRIETKTEYRQSDILIQYFGIFLLLVSLVFSYFVDI